MSVAEGCLPASSAEAEPGGGPSEAPDKFAAEGGCLPAYSAGAEPG